MSAPPKLFDRDLLRLRQARAFRQSGGSADFLVRAVAADIAERIALIKREFALAVDLGTPAPQLADMLTRADNVGRIIRAGSPPGEASLDVVCDEEALPLADASIDLVVSGLALHWVNDLPGSLIQIARALKPDGLFVGALMGAGTLRELREALTSAEEELRGGAGARIAPFADVRDMGALLQRAGFALPVCDGDELVVTYSSMFDLLADLRRMGATNVMSQRSRVPLTRAVLARAAELYSKRYPADGGRVRATFNIVYATGWRPHESQQKPLAPGSAKMRLAQALGTDEISLEEKPPRDEAK